MGGGKYYLCIPDKRYCFDHYKNDTTIGDVLDSHYNKTTEAPIRILVNEITTHAHNDAIQHWNGQHGEPAGIDFNQLKKELKCRSNCITPHCWFLYPEKFEEIMYVLKQLGLTKFIIKEIYNTPANSVEFYVVLEKI